jgi:hypothetical protein
MDMIVANIKKSSGKATARWNANSKKTASTKKSENAKRRNMGGIVHLRSMCLRLPLPTAYPLLTFLDHGMKKGAGFFPAKFPTHTLSAGNKENALFAVD